MKTNAMSLPAAACAAACKSVSLKEEETTVPSALARSVIASMGYRCMNIDNTSQSTRKTYRDEIGEVIGSTVTINQCAVV